MTILRDQAELASAGPDHVVTFQLETSALRGRVVRLGPVLDDILGRHDYPPAVARLLAEILTVTVLLADMLKYDGIFTLQVKGDGPVPMVVADITSSKALRGYALVRAEDAESLARVGSARALLGDGYLAFTVDQGDHTDRYQGVVELTGDNVTDFVQHYFRQSEQIETGLAVAVAERDGGWSAGGISLQHMPGEADAGARSNVEEDDWRRSMLLLSSVTEAELTAPELSADRLLYRLFHEEGVRVFTDAAVSRGCRCSRQRVALVLASIPPDQIADYAEEGEITMTCEFCNETFRFTATDLDALGTQRAE